MARPRESPFGTTNGELKRALEFDYDDFVEIDQYCRAVNISWFAACWDEPSVDLINRFDVPCFKIASASLTDDNLLRHTKATGKPILLYTGMSTVEEIDDLIDVLGKDNLAILHACSTDPAYDEGLNLQAIRTLEERYGVPVGYSGHESGSSRSLPSRWGLASSSATSPSIAPCGDRTRRHLWSQTELPNW